jgi:uncharacterized membrane protein YeiB
VKVFERIAVLFVDALSLYLALGVVFAVVFVSVGVKRIDSQAVGTGVGFRILIFPGSVAFWPLLLRRWARGIAEPPLERNPHR